MHEERDSVELWNIHYIIRNFSVDAHSAVAALLVETDQAYLVTRANAWVFFSFLKRTERHLMRRFRQCKYMFYTFAFFATIKSELACECIRIL